MKVHFYYRMRGDRPVVDFIENTENEKHQNKIFKMIEKLENNGLHLLQTNDAEKIKKNLYELKIEYGKIFYRIFFTTTQDYYCLIHAFSKKTNKTPPKEINKAEVVKENLELRIKQNNYNFNK